MRKLLSVVPTLGVLALLLAPVGSSAAAPTGSLYVKNQATIVNSTAVDLELSCNDPDGIGCLDMQIATDGNADTEGFVSYSTSYTANVAGEGQHTIAVRFRDFNSEISAQYTINVTVDTSPPTAPSNLVRTSASTDATATFNWNSSADGNNVDHYQVRVNNSTWTNVGTALTYTTSSLSVGSHIFEVRSVDVAGNMSSTATLNFTIEGGADVNQPTPPSESSLSIMEEGSVLINNQDTVGLLVQLNFASESQCEWTTETAENRVRYVFGTVIDTEVASKIKLFARCGTESTLKLGAGERLGAVNSFRAAFGRVPSTQVDWFDVIKIGNGRFTSQISANAEARAQTKFKTIYLRDPNMSNEADRNAVIVMAYGLRPFPRNLNAEAQAIIHFTAIFGYSPSSATDWDAVRAIAYSGAAR